MFAIADMSPQIQAELVYGDYLTYCGGNFNTSANNGGAGRFEFDRDPVNGGTEFQGTLNTDGWPLSLAGDDDLHYAFCLEPNEYLSEGVYDVAALEAAPVSGVNGSMGNMASIEDPRKETRADDLRRLFGGVYSDFADADPSGSGDNALNAAFFAAPQIAVWEIANESKTTLDAGGSNFIFEQSVCRRSSCEHLVGEA